MNNLTPLTNPDLRLDMPGKMTDHQSYNARMTLLARAKLKEVSRISALLAGFAMVAMVEVDINTQAGMSSSGKDCQTAGTCLVPNYILILFAIVTTVLIAVYLFALMVATCILPNLQTIKANPSMEFLPPYERFQHYITIAWAFSTVLGIILFMAEFALICWIKFWTVSPAAAWVATAILVPVAFIFLGFAMHFHRSLFEHKIQENNNGLAELEQLASHLGGLDHTDPQRNLLSNSNSQNNIHHV